MRSHITALALAAAPIALCGACHQQTPQEKQADQVKDAADAKADALEASAGNQAAGMISNAEDLERQAGQTGSFEAKRLKVHANALKDEASLIKKEGEAKAKAIRDEGQAKASAILAQ